MSGVDEDEGEGLISRFSAFEKSRAPLPLHFALEDAQRAAGPCPAWAAAQQL